MVVDVIVSGFLIAIMIVTMCTLVFTGVATFTLIKKTFDEDDN